MRAFGKNKILGVALSAVALIAIAKTWGPFHVSAAGPEFATTTFDSDVEYVAANRLASIYLSGVLNTPSKIAKAIRDDFIRVVYYDGQIYDYKIALWPSSAPLNDPKQMPTVHAPGRMSPGDREKERRAMLACREGVNSVLTWNTGYWGFESVPDPIVPNRFINTATWIDTGTQTERIKDCNGK